MSKNTRNTEFRKIDVDQYDEEKYKEEDDLGMDGLSMSGAPEDGTTARSPSGGVLPSLPPPPSDAEVTALLNSGRNLDALKLVLKNAPLGTKNQLVKDQAAILVLRVLMSIKIQKMDEAIKGLERDELDTLMKYVYRGFEVSSEGNSGQLLTWHEKVYNEGGLGCIVRVLTDRKRV